MAADVAGFTGFSATMEHNGVESQAAAVSDCKNQNALNWLAVMLA
jgi:hypothetical protein